MKVNLRFLFVLSLVTFCVACGGGEKHGPVTPILSANARLVDLSISAGDFDQIFQASLTDYTLTVSLLRSTTTVTVTIEDPNATLTVNGVVLSSGTASQMISLDHGGNTITVVVTAEDAVTTSTYTIEVTRQTAASFAQQAYIKASNTGAWDLFGVSIALSGDTLAVGAPTEDSDATGIGGDQINNSADESGAVYVFTRDPAGVWSQQAYIKASNPDEFDRFGQSVAISGDTLAVGATGEDSAATGIGGDQDDNIAVDAGAVYVFTRDLAGVWSQQAYIKASNAAVADRRRLNAGFGNSIALSGDTLAVGAYREDSDATGIDGDQINNGADESGAVYVFTRDAVGAWSQQAYVKASNTDEFDWFGGSVAISGDTLAVGAWGEASNATGIDGDQSNNDDKNAGAAYVFTRDAAGVWSQQAYVKASNAQFDDRFGWALALSGDTLAVSAPSERDSGVVYVFSHDSTASWSQQAFIEANDGDEFGWSLGISDDALVVGAPREDSTAIGVDGDQTDNAARDSGAAYLFTRDAVGAWSQEAYIKASNTGSEDSFGTSVAISGDTVAIGATHEDSATTGIEGDQSDNSATSAGAVYVLR